MAQDCEAECGVVQDGTGGPKGSEVGVNEAKNDGDGRTGG